MHPAIKHLRSAFPELPQLGVDFLWNFDVALEVPDPEFYNKTLPFYPILSTEWNFDVALEALGPEFYNKILPFYPILNTEYSLLCAALHEDFSSLQEDQLLSTIERLKAALLFCELLEHINQHYLIVPREVARLRKQQQLFRTLLTEVENCSFTTHMEDKEISTNFALSHLLHDVTSQANGYRILINRCKRVINLSNAVLTESRLFNTFVACLDKYTNPALAYLNLILFTPRFLTYLFLFLKHTIPGFWMGNKEASLKWAIRFLGQLQSRWFELSNDATWIIIGAVNVYLLLGGVLTGAVYLSAAAFAFDIVNSATRAYIEFKRLHHLQKDYEKMLANEPDLELQKLIEQHIKYLNKRIHFEHLRLGTHVLNVVLVFAGMALALPIFALPPAVILVSAISLLLLWVVNFTITKQINNSKPKEILDKVNVSQWSLFAVNKTKILPHEKVPSKSSPEPFDPKAGYGEHHCVLRKNY